MSESCCCAPERTEALAPQNCADCRTLGCAKGNGNYPTFCATVSLGDYEAESIRHEYQDDPETYAFMQGAAETNARGFAEALCRVEETMDYCHRMGYRKIGLAFCVGVIKEANIMAKILRAQGYDVVAIACKVGSMSNADMGLKTSCCNFGAVSCNPLVQANMLNQAHADFNIVMGLCVGHDSFFYKHSDAPCTTLFTKDKILVHNAIAALRAADTESSLYRRMLVPNPSFGPQG